MKLNKIFAVALAVLAMTSCDDTNVEDFPNFLGAVNTASGVTVSLPTTYSFDEDAGEAYVPVYVTGTANGKVQVTVQVKELTSTPAGTEPAKLNEHYTVTSYSVNIPEGESEGGIEILPIWTPGVVNDDRVFEVEIVSVVGAAIGNKECQVTIVNIDDHFTGLLGNWVLRGTNSSGAQVSYSLNFKQYTDEDDPYGKVIYGFGIFGESDYLLPLNNFTFDESTMTGTIDIAYGYMMTDGKAFNYGLEALAFPVCLFRSGNNVTMNHVETCTFDDTYSEIVIPSTANIFAGLYYTTTYAFSGYSVGQLSNMTLTRN
ncbi:MAG: hypothetical protein NC111_01405 [Bacteroides sp.]|nr:hypothetical protein [Bacteroides sp.]MCM1413612.1 hypothetical protein [Bacteroides sp.]MCM1471171.1 hypothetical protein [Bacteroides sp.]